MSKAYLQPFLIFPDATLGSMLVTLAGETDATPVYDPNTGSILSQPLGINSVGEVTPFHANDNVLYDLHVFAAGVSAVVGNQLYSRENVTIVGGVSGAVGPAGPAGPTGPKGDKGDTGATGETGATGAAGTNGTNGINGTNGADGIAGYIQLPALPVDPSTVPIGQPVILPDGTLWTNVTGSWTALAVSEAMLDAALAELAPVDAITDGSTKAVTSNAVFDGMATKVNLTGYPAQVGGASSTADYFLTQTNFDRGLSGQFYYYLHEYELAITANDLSSALGKAYVQVAFTSENGDVSVAVTVLGGDPDVCDRVYYKLTTAATIQQVELGLSFGANTVASARLIHASGSTGYTIAYFTSLFVMSGTKAPLIGAVTAPAGDNSQAIATTAFVGKPSGSVITLSSSQTVTPANGAVYYVGWSHDITLSNSSALGTRCYIQADGNCPQNSKILFTDVAGNSNGVGFGYGDTGAGGVMCERFADGWMVVGGVAQ